MDIGDRVEADQLLADLFLPELKDELRQKEAALVQAQAEIELAAAAVRAAEAAVATAQANVSAGGGRQHPRRGGLHALAVAVRADQRNWWPAARWTASSKTRRRTRSRPPKRRVARPARRWKPPRPRLLQSQADLAKAKADEAVARARRGNAEADLSRVKALLQYTQIRAPYAGVVTERNVNRGDFVQPASTMTAKPLLTVARTDLVRIFVDVPEMDSPWVEAGRTGYVSVQALPDRIVEGKVTRTSWALGTIGPCARNWTCPIRTACCGRGCTPPPTSCSKSVPTFTFFRPRPLSATAGSVLLDGPRRSGRSDADYSGPPGRK